MSTTICMPPPEMHPGTTTRPATSHRVGLSTRCTTIRHAMTTIGHVQMLIITTSAVMRTNPTTSTTMIEIPSTGGTEIDGTQSTSLLSMRLPIARVGDHQSLSFQPPYFCFQDGIVTGGLGAVGHLGAIVLSIYRLADPTLITTPIPRTTRSSTQTHFLRLISDGGQILAGIATIGLIMRPTRVALTDPSADMVEQQLQVRSLHRIRGRAPSPVV